jgi:hypothetical protein
VGQARSGRDGGGASPGVGGPLAISWGGGGARGRLVREPLRVRRPGGRRGPAEVRRCLADPGPGFCGVRCFRNPEARSGRSRRLRSGPAFLISGRRRPRQLGTCPRNRPRPLRAFRMSRFSGRRDFSGASGQLSFDVPEKPRPPLPSAASFPGGPPGQEHGQVSGGPRPRTLRME